MKSPTSEIGLSVLIEVELCDTTQASVLYLIRLALPVLKIASKEDQFYTHLVTFVFIINIQKLRNH